MPRLHPPNAPPSATLHARTHACMHACMHAAHLCAARWLGVRVGQRAGCCGGEADDLVGGPPPIRTAAGPGAQHHSQTCTWGYRSVGRSNEMHVNANGRVVSGGMRCTTSSCGASVRHREKCKPRCHAQWSNGTHGACMGGLASATFQASNQAGVWMQVHGCMHSCMHAFFAQQLLQHDHTQRWRPCWQCMSRTAARGAPSVPASTCRRLPWHAGARNRSTPSQNGILTLKESEIVQAAPCPAHLQLLRYTHAISASAAPSLPTHGCTDASCSDTARSLVLAASPDQSLDIATLPV